MSNYRVTIWLAPSDEEVFDVFSYNVNVDGFLELVERENTEDLIRFNLDNIKGFQVEDLQP